MTKRLIRALLGGAACALLPLAASAQAVPSAAEPLLASMRQHVTLATNAAGAQFGFLANMMCLNAVTGGDFVGQFWGSQYMRGPDQDIEPVQAFDNLYYIGLRQNGAWVLKTSAGLILLDSLYPEDTQTRVLPNMKKLGLDPAQVKYVIVGHAHSDHMGGAKYFQDTYGAKVVMTAEDWDFALKGGEAGDPKYVPRRDVVARDGDKITLGDTTVSIYFTPGHTPGALSAILPVRDKGAAHMAAWWGGPQWGLRNKPVREREILENSFQHFGPIAAAAKVDVALESHPFLSNMIVALTGMKARKPGAPNPLVLGTEGYGRYFTVWHECARANMDRYKANLLIYGPDPRTWPPEINATTAASARLGVRPAGE